MLKKIANFITTLSSKLDVGSSANIIPGSLTSAERALFSSLNSLGLHLLFHLNLFRLMFLQKSPF